MSEINSKTKVTVYFDTRSYSKKNGGHPIKLRLYHQQKERPIKLGYYCEAKNWIFGDLENKEYVESIEKKNPAYIAKKQSNARRLNLQIDRKLIAARDFLLKNEKNLKDYNPDSLKQAVQHVVDNLDDEADLNELLMSSITLVKAFEKKIEEAGAQEDWGIKGTYSDSLNQYRKYLDFLGVEDVELIKIDTTWLDKFHSWYRVQPNPKGGKIKPNTINKRMNQLRHLMKRAAADKNEKLTFNDNPFNTYQLPKNKSSKRAIEMDKLDQEALKEKFDMSEVANVMDLFRQIRLQTGSKKWHARNYLLFMWNCRGMDLVDLTFLLRSNIRNGLCEYYRRKVKGEVFITIDLNEEAMEILEIYDFKKKSPNELIFPFMADHYNPEDGVTEEVYSKYRNRIRYFNGHITKLAEELGIDGAFTSKMIRHTWAQTGFNAVESRDVVGEGLGHENDSTTRIYAKELDRRKIKAANSKITKRKSLISSVDYKLQIDLFQYFHRGTAWSVEPNEFRNRVVKKIHSYGSMVMKILAKKQIQSEWDTKIDELSNIEFESYDEVNDWLQGNLKELCESHDIQLITTKYI